MSKLSNTSQQPRSQNQFRRSRRRRSGVAAVVSQLGPALREEKYLEDRPKNIWRIFEKYCVGRAAAAAVSQVRPAERSLECRQVCAAPSLSRLDIHNVVIFKHEGLYFNNIRG